MPRKNHDVININIEPTEENIKVVRESFIQEIIEDGEVGKNYSKEEWAYRLAVYMTAKAFNDPVIFKIKEYTAKRKKLITEMFRKYGDKNHVDEEL
jgi:hypothetical protein